MIETVSFFVLGGISVSIVLSAYRVLRGPTIADRVVALDNIATNLVAAIIVYSIYIRRVLYTDVALVLAILAFLSTVAAARFLLGGTVIDGPSTDSRSVG